MVQNIFADNLCDQYYFLFLHLTRNANKKEKYYCPLAKFLWDVLKNVSKDGTSTNATKIWVQYSQSNKML